MCMFYCFRKGPHISFKYARRWWEKYLSKRSLLKHTCSWRDKLIVLSILKRQAKMFWRILNSPFLPVICETNVKESIDFSSFSLWGYLFLSQMGFLVHVHAHRVYMKEGLLFAFNLTFLKNSKNYCLFFWLAQR